MRGFEDIGSKGHFSAKKGGFWVQNPPGEGSQKKFVSKEHQKWIQHHQITQTANFQQNPTTFKNRYHRGDF